MYYRHIFQAVHCTPSIDQSLPHKIKPEVEDQRPDYHDWDEADDSRTANKYTESGSGEHQSCDTAISSASHEEHSVCVDQIIL